MACSFTYDVFLSFRGSDTRYGFTGNLHKALSDKGIHTFIDDEDLQKGEEITPTLLKAIEESRTAIVVFSKHYASSTFCLVELVKILECVKHKGRLVWPVFYEVLPSDLRHIKGSYGEAMAKHESRFKSDKDKLNKWKLALQEAASLSGSYFQQGIEYEHIFIERIVKEISKRTNRVILPIANHPVGIESRVQKVTSLLEVGSNEEVIMVGIYGTGGIGKTTIARAVYNLIADQFDSVCFLADVRDNSIKRGLVQLQETMLSEIVGEKDIKLTNVWTGISIIKRRLSKKRIFLILDDIDKLDQLEGLAGEPDWFGLGSRIIITTRNEHLLRFHGVARKYEVETLSHGESHELFTSNAFKGKDFDPSYLDVLNSLVLYCSGLPLALEVISCNLFGKRLDEWKSALHIYENIPEKTIQQILRISYDDLGDIEKEIFLDMACFFKGHSLGYAENVISNARDIPPKASIGALMDRSLIKIDQYGIVSMHDLIEDMGKEIVRKESPLEPGRRSRLWFYDDIIHVFEENTGTDNIEAIVWHSNGDTKVRWNGNTLKKMMNLRILILRNVSFSKGPKYLPNNLRYLEWEKYPSSTLPFNFNPKKIAINLKDNCLTSFKLVSNFKLMSEINLMGSKFLNRVPDISEASCLRKLTLDKCTNLIEVDSSVGTLDKLCNLSASDCTNLKIFPEVIKSTSLELLDLSRCPSLESVPIMSGVMQKITGVSFHNCTSYTRDHNSGAFKLGWRGSNFDLSIGLFKLPKVEKRIGVGHLRKCRIQDRESVNLAISSNIRSLEIRGSNVPITNHSTWFPCCLRMEELDFFSNYSIHECLSSLVLCFPNLEVLKLRSDSWNNDIPAWHPSLANLRSFVQKFNIFADEFVFTCLRSMSNLQELDLSHIDFTILPECINECHLLRILQLDYCKLLREIRGMPPNIEFLSVKECTSLSAQSRSILLSQTLHKAGTKEFVLPGTMIPEWFNHRQSTVESLSFWVRNKFPERIIFSFVHTERIQYNLLVDGIHCSQIETKFGLYTKIPHIHLLHVPIGDAKLIGERWTRIEFSIHKPRITNVVSCIGVHVYPKEKNSIKDVRFTDPNPGKSKVDKDMGDINPDYYLSLKNWCPFLEMNFFGIHSHRYLWNTWKMQAPAKVKILVCQIEARCLPTCEYLFSKKLIKNPLCPICEAAYETIEHVFLDCPWTQAVWFGSDLQWVVDFNCDVSLVKDWLEIRLWDDENLDYPALNKIMSIVGNICWAIWKERNEYILEGKPVDPALALLTVKNLYNQYPAHSCPLLQNIFYPTSEITNQGENALWSLYARIIKIGEFSGEKVEAGLNYDRTKGKSILIAGNNNNAAETSDTLDLDSTIHSEEAGLSYDRAKGKSILIAGNSKNEAKTSYTLDLDSTIHNVETEEMGRSDSEVEGTGIVRACDSNIEVNQGHQRRSWLTELAIQLLRCLPLPETGVQLAAKHW